EGRMAAASRRVILSHVRAVTPLLAVRPASVPNHLTTGVKKCSGKKSSSFRKAVARELGPAVVESGRSRRLGATEVDKLPPLNRPCCQSACVPIIPARNAGQLRASTRKQPILNELFWEFFGRPRRPKRRAEFRSAVCITPNRTGNTIVRLEALE